MKTNSISSIKDDPPSKDRLINTVRSFLHRQTHESRLFGTAIVQFPSITEETVKVQFCEAEKLLYEKIADVFFERINGKLCSYNNKCINNSN